MAKMKKFPKQPKMTASQKTWDNYEKKCADVTKHNDGVKAVKKKKEATKAKVQKMKDKKK
ncbi:hypothetical protein [Runella sp.]|uniref:hypothetical protein n=1 Tax=Runella sp. TaxID=1960881 RepID=UPI003D0F9CAE